MTHISISALFLQPIKSCAQESVQRIQIDRFGPAGDRRRMFINPNGAAVTQRTHPQLALLKAHAWNHPKAGHCVELRHPRLGIINLSEAQSEQGERRHVTIHKRHTIGCIEPNHKVQQWAEELFGEGCRLVFCPEDVSRSPDQVIQAHTCHTAFSDGFPFLIISEESLDALNQEIQASGGEAVPMSRFRPTIVVSGCPEPFDEDQWASFEINQVHFEAVYRSQRCNMTMVDPMSGVSVGPEPLRTLSRMRMLPKPPNKRRPMFGINVNHLDLSGEIHVGDRVQIHRRGQPLF